MNALPIHAVRGSKQHAGGGGDTQPAVMFKYFNMSFKTGCVTLLQMRACGPSLATACWLSVLTSRSVQPG